MATVTTTIQNKPAIKAASKFLQKIMIMITLDDFSQDKRNCATCTAQRALCEREKYKAHKGYIKGLYGEISGIIYCCVNYQGRY